MTLDEHLLSGVEHHPLEPFLPENAVLLMLGSFPPQKKRWSMDFFYPNLQNDMWRIFGFIFFDVLFFIVGGHNHRQSNIVIIHFLLLKK